MKKAIAIAAATIGITCMAQSALAAGYVEDATAGNGLGWACDPSNPTYQGNVRIVRDDNVLLWQGAANGARESAVGAVCGGNSNHGFDAYWNPTSAQWTGQFHNVHFYFVRPNGILEEIPGSPKLVCFGTVISPGAGCGT